MTERFPPKMPFEFADLLASVGIDMAPVETDRRLLLPPRSAERHLEEFFSPQLSRRLIVGNVNGPDVAVHRALLAHNVPVLPASELSVQGLHLWEVPLGSYPLRSVLHLVAQNIERYGSVLSQAKDVMAAAASTPLGVLASEKDRTVLDHFVFVQTAGGLGAEVLLAPPYGLKPGDGVEGLRGLREELAATELFSSEHLAYVFDDGQALSAGN